MGCHKIVLDAETIKKANLELNSIKDSRLSIQLKAIIASGEHTVEDVAHILHYSARTIFRWIRKFKELGIAGLRDKPKGHMRSKLTDTHRAQILEWIDTRQDHRGERINWSIDKLIAEVKNVFGVEISKTPFWKQLKKMGLVLRKPRPVHYKTDKSVQEAFKKNERNNR